MKPVRCKLRQWGEKNGLSIYQIADKLSTGLDVSTVTIYRWVNNIAEPRISQAIAIASILGTKIEDIFQLEEKKQP